MDEPTPMGDNEREELIEARDTINGVTMLLNRLGVPAGTGVPMTLEARIEWLATHGGPRGRK